MKLALSGKRVIGYGENLIPMGGTIIDTDTNKVYQNATIAECDGCPSDIDAVGYEYHAGTFVPCAPYAATEESGGEIMVACDTCATPRKSGVNINDVLLKKLPGAEFSTAEELDAYLLAQFSEMGNYEIRNINIQMTADLSVQGGLDAGNWFVEINKGIDYGKIIAKTSFYEATRAVANNVLYAWEWFNPYMEIGVEYITTKRYNLRAVYAKLLDAGTLPANSYKDVNIGTTISGLVDLKVSCVSGGTEFKILPDDGVMANVRFGTLIRIFSLNKDMSAYTGKIYIEYTKG